MKLCLNRISYSFKVIVIMINVAPVDEMVTHQIGVCKDQMFDVYTSREWVKMVSHQQ